MLQAILLYLVTTLLIPVPGDKLCDMLRSTSLPVIPEVSQPYPWFHVAAGEV
jgi:hypothetical protein